MSYNTANAFTLRLDVAELCPFLENADFPVFLIKNVDAILKHNKRRIYQKLYCWKYFNKPTWAHMCAFQANYEHRKHGFGRKPRWLVDTQLWINPAHNLSLMSRLLLKRIQMIGQARLKRKIYNSSIG